MSLSQALNQFAQNLGRYPARLAEGVAGIEYDDDRPDPGEYDIAFTADVGVQGGGR